MNSGISMCATRKPVVVLAGWLGCQPRHLRRYIEMYSGIGWQPIVRIGNPQAVVAALSHGPSSNDQSSSQSEMKIVSLNLLQELRTLQPPLIAFHIFSNNGCFLWEWVRHLIFERTDWSSSSSVDSNTVKEKIIGVIFDSAPAYYDGNASEIQTAFQYLDSTAEKERLLEITQTLDPQLMKQRFDNYWSGLRNDTINIPQLYLYSEHDALTSAQHLEELIAYRTEVMREKNIIWKHAFTESAHCAHLLKYPQEYTESVTQFLNFCENIQFRGTRGDLGSELSGRSRL